MVQRALGGAARGARRTGRVQPVLQNVDVERTQELRAEVVQLLHGEMEFVDEVVHKFPFQLLLIGDGRREMPDDEGGVAFPPLHGLEGGGPGLAGNERCAPVLVSRHEH